MTQTDEMVYTSDLTGGTVVGGVVPEGDAMLRRKADPWIDAIEGFKGWMRSADRAESTIRQRSSALLQAAAGVGFKSPWKVTLDDLVTWIGSGDWSRQTRHSYACVLRTFYAWAVKVGRTKHNPATDLPTISVNRGLPHPTPDNVYERAIAQADDRTRLVLMLASHASMRRSEIAHAEWAHFTDTHVWIRGKGDKERIVPLHVDLKLRLDVERAKRAAGEMGTGFHPGSHDSRYVFPARGGGHIHPATVNSIVKRALGNEWSAHSLRHRFGTTLLENTGDLAAVQELMGHSDPGTTRIYAKVSVRRLKSAIDSL